MNLTWHIVRKDFLRFRFLLLAWIAVLVAKILFLSSVTGLLGSPNISLLPWLQSGSPVQAVIGAIAPLFVLFLVAALVFEDAPTGRDPFWVTRPISGGRLLTAKLLSAALMLFVPVVLADVAWWLICGLATDKIVAFGSWTAGNTVLLVLVGMACASATNGYPRFVVWLIAGVAAVIGCHLFPLIFGLTGKQVDAPNFYGGVVSVCLGILAVEILFNRFITRRFRAGLPIVAALTLLGSAWLFSSAPASILAMVGPKSWKFAEEAPIRASVAGDVHTVNGGGLTLPVRLDKLPSNVVANIQMQATWHSPEGKVWTTKSGRSNFRSTLRRVARRVLGLAPDPSAKTAEQVLFILPRANADRVAAEATTVEGTASLYLNEATPVAEIPVRPQVSRFAGGSLTISDVAINEGDVSFFITTRLGFEPERYYGIGYIALLNRRTGELIESSQDQPLLHRGPRTEHDVTLACIWVRFKIPNRAWLEESRFVFVATSVGYSVQREIASYTRTSVKAELDHPAPVTVPPDVLKDYVGTYQPRPGAKLVVKVVRGGLSLSLEDSGFFRMVVVPETNTHFIAPNQNWLFASEGGYSVDFVRDAQGIVTHFIVHQGGRDFVVPRMNAIVTPNPDAH
jgi:hypothetical protein